VEIFCYHARGSRDAVTAQLRATAEHWRDLTVPDDDAAAALIHADGIDVLVDLAGHTAGNRLLVFARRPAPVQVTWLGYPNTTGLATMDARLTDAVCVPAEGNDAPHGPEKLVRLPGVFCCYQPPPDCPPTEPTAGTNDRPFTFCSFSNLAKITPATVAVWAQILAARSDARLLLKSPGANDPSTQEYFRAQFAALGVAPRRIEFNGEALPMRRHLELYHTCDIALDPFPYNGTTTTCEALLMGVPVVTLAGSAHVSRVGASFLSALGMPELITHTPTAYVLAATALAADVARRTELRATLRPRLLASPLGQTAEFTRNLEAALRSCHDSAVGR
jgi:predicted O-linked N-acetylglucosamine transferase (SPINDLY family)